MCVVAYGDNARNQARLALNGLRNHNDVDISIISDAPLDGAKFVAFPDHDTGARWAKLNLDTLSPYNYTLYMDADTRVHGTIMQLFKILQDGFDMLVAPSTQQNTQCLHHVSETEREATFGELCNGQPLQLQGGVMGFRKSIAITELFSVWCDEWQRWHDQDQGALLRALDAVKNKPRVWLLSNEFNGGAIVAHHFGRARRAA